jgi:O-antigen/teichoic acid export membrane protein
MNKSPTLETQVTSTEQIGLIGNLFRPSAAVRQTSYLFLCQVIGIFLGFGVNLINTRYLGPVDYGLYAAAFAVTEFATLFLDFGFFSSGARVLALKQNSPEQRQKLIGALILIAIVLSCLGALVLWGVSFFALRLLNAPIGPLLRWFSLLLGLLTFQTLVESTCRGTGRIESLSLYNISSKGFGLVLLGLAIASGVYTLPLAMAASLVGSFVASVHVLYGFRPKFANLSPALRELWRDLKVYGFHAYTGDLACTASSRTDSLILSHFVNATAVGYYRLAALIMTPMITFSRSLSTTLFTRFALSKRISFRVFAANGAWLSLCFLGVALAGRPIVQRIFGSRYDRVSDLLPLVALACLSSGLTQPLNKFLGAQGKGRYLRSIALLISVCGLVLNFALIPRYGIMGACYAGALGMFINLLLHFYYYRRTVRSVL